MKAAVATAIDVTAAKVVASPSRPPGVGRGNTQMDNTSVPFHDNDVTAAKVAASPSRPTGVGRGNTQMQGGCVPLNDNHVAAIEVRDRLGSGRARRFGKTRHLAHHVPRGLARAVGGAEAGSSGHGCRG